MVSRFTPTRVGKSALLLMLRVVYPVHPHTCGEITKLQSIKHVSFGSPPHVWGNRCKPGGEEGAIRFTPTRVGKSWGARLGGGGYAVHPHTCGEITVNDADGLLSNGSPPHVWGNLNMNAKQVGAMRFTPTRVGKSYALGVSGRFYAVHPHTCGEISLSNERQN